VGRFWAARRPTRPRTSPLWGSALGPSTTTGQEPDALIHAMTDLVAAVTVCELTCSFLHPTVMGLGGALLVDPR